MKRTVLSITSAIAFYAAGPVQSQDAIQPVDAPQPAKEKPSLRDLQELIAKEFAKASPIADPGDARARDAASARLAGCQNFLAAAGKRMLWGGCEPVKGYDPKTYTLTEFDPLVWMKLYASTMMFTGEYEVKAEGQFSVLEMKAKFRSSLDPGDYPYPFWHSPKKWQAYVDLASLCVVFHGDKLAAVYRVAAAGPSKPIAERKWDGKWQWTDATGNAQPRVALFSYMFSADNPHRANVDETYRKLEARFRAHECTACHAPDNAEKSTALLLLNYPNQSLIARRNLVQVLRDKEMPPKDTAKHQSAGIADDAQRAELVRLAEVFVKAADDAVAFEAARTAAMKDRK